jgi:hypothetical protein
VNDDERAVGDGSEVADDPVPCLVGFAIDNEWREVALRVTERHLGLDLDGSRRRLAAGRDRETILQRQSYMFEAHHAMVSGW